jgi:hypothetical protein
MDNFAFLKLAISDSLLGYLDLPRVENEPLILILLMWRI